MRLRVSLLVVATSSLVLVSFLVPLALVLRTLATDRAVSAATAEAQSLAPLVTTLEVGSLRLTVDQVNAETSTPVTVFLPSGTELGQPAAVSPAVRLARNGRSFSAEAPGGEQVLVAVEGLPAGSAVIRTFVPGSVLRHGVTRAWLLLGGVGLLLLLLSVLVADRLARSLVRPLTALAQASDRLAAGDLSARAAVAGPPEVRRAGAGLNRLAVRIGELLAHERETVADLSHRLRTPLTALRIDAESLRDDAEMERLLADVGSVERTVSEIIREARRPGGEGRWVGAPRCSATRPGSSPNGPRSGGRSPKTRTAGCSSTWLPAPYRSSWPRMTWRPARTSCWETCSRIPPRAPASPCGSAGARRGAHGWWSPTTDPASVRPTRPSAASQAAVPPASAWTSPAASPKRPAGR